MLAPSFSFKSWPVTLANDPGLNNIFPPPPLPSGPIHDDIEKQPDGAGIFKNSWQICRGKKGEKKEDDFGKSRKRRQKTGTFGKFPASFRPHFFTRIMIDW